MKQIIIASIAVTLTACTAGAPEQFYRPAGATEQVVISGNFNQITFDHTVSINGKLTVQGSLPYSYEDSSFSGQYEDMNVTSDCHWKSKSDLRCLVKINGEPAANLAF